MPGNRWLVTGEALLRPCGAGHRSRITCRSLKASAKLSAAKLGQLRSDGTALTRDGSSCGAGSGLRRCRSPAQVDLGVERSATAGPRNRPDLAEPISLWGWNWPGGLVRRALLEVGRRLVDIGRVHEAGQVVELFPDELDRVLKGGPEPSADELARPSCRPPSKGSPASTSRAGALATTTRPTTHARGLTRFARPLRRS